MQNLNSLSTYGAHPKEFDPEQVKPVLNNLTTIIKWYLKYKDAQTISKPKAEEVKDEIKVSDDSAKKIQKPKKRLIILFSGIALVIVIAILLVFDIIGVEKGTEELEKSIAVLPFFNESEDQENTYFINGIMDEVLINLQTIKDLRVVSRSSVEQYRDPSRPTSPEIAKKLDVNYIVEGSGQKFGNTIRLRVQLLGGAEDRHLWGKSYEQEILKPRDIFNIQSQIAQVIAAELKAIITPEEKQLIEKTPTANLTALDFYQRGREEYKKYFSENNNREALERAEDLYHKALEYDSTFARVYTGLAWVYWEKNIWSEFFSESYMDSALILADIALSHDDQLAEAYNIKGYYYSTTGKVTQAVENYDMAIKFNPNSASPYFGKAWIYWLNNDLVKSIENFHKAVSIDQGPELPTALKNLSHAYCITGFFEKSNYYSQKAFELDGDSVAYYHRLARSEELLGNYSKAVEFGEKGYAIDSNYIPVVRDLGSYYLYFGQYKKSLSYHKKCIERLKAQGKIELYYMYLIGYSFWQNGYKEEAKYYFDEQIKYSEQIIKRGEPGAENQHIQLASVYAFRGEKDKAYEHLRIFNQQEWMNIYVMQIRYSPFFESIRDEPEFQQIVSELEAKYQAEHERVRKWLEEQGDLPD